MCSHWTVRTLKGLLVGPNPIFLVRMCICKLFFFNKQYHFYESAAGVFHMLSSAPSPNPSDEVETERWSWRWWWESPRGSQIWALKRKVTQEVLMMVVTMATVICFKQFSLWTITWCNLLRCSLLLHLIRQTQILMFQWFMLNVLGTCVAVQCRM